MTVRIILKKTKKDFGETSKEVWEVFWGILGIEYENYLFKGKQKKVYMWEFENIPEDYPGGIKCL
jgi:hypothetical protein